MRLVPGRKIWIGNAGDLRDAKSIFDIGIEAIVELADNEPMVVLPRDLIRLRFPISDSGENPEWLLSLAVGSLASLLKSNVPMLVCCSGGMNRSVCVVAAAIARLDRKPIEEVIVTLCEH